MKALPVGCQVKVEQANSKTVSGIFVRADDAGIVVRVKKNKAPEVRKADVVRVDARPFKPAWQRSETSADRSTSTPTVGFEREHTKYKTVYQRP